MKKMIAAICILACILGALSGCSHPLQNEGGTNGSQPAVRDPNTTYIDLYPDWPHYDTAEALLEAATHAYLGKVTDVSYEIINTATAKAEKVDPAQSSQYMLYTVYTVQVTECLQGETPETVRVCIIGGTVSGAGEAQLQVAEESGFLAAYGGIPVVAEDFISLSEGHTYLFCTKRSTGDYDFAVNGTQFAFEEGSANADTVQSLLK